MTQRANTFKKNTYKPKKKATSDIDGKDLNLQTVKDFFRSQRLTKTLGLLLLIASLFLLFSFISYLFSWKYDDALLEGRVFNWALLTESQTHTENWMGRLGAVVSHWLIKQWFGIAAFFIVLMAFITGFRMLFGISLLPLRKTYAYSLFLMLWVSVLLGFVVKPGSWSVLGGVLGYQSKVWLNGTIGQPGTALLLLFSMGTFLILVFDPNLKAFAEWLKNVFATNRNNNAGSNEDSETGSFVAASGEEAPATEEEIASSLELFTRENQSNEGSPETKHQEADINGEIPEESQQGAEEAAGHTLEIEVGNGKISGSNYQAIDEPFSGENDMPDLSHLGEFDPTLDLPKYRVPGLDLLDDKGSSTIQVNKQELEANKDRIIETLNNYAIQIDRIKATVGPTVTLYEIIPAPGVRISKIKNLENDIALSLSALGIRIIAPIPGRGTIGIEVPNGSPEIVSMKSILASDRFQNSGFDLPIGLGKTIANETFIADLTKMPHLLMAGATGQGKSVGLNAVLASILYKKHPAYVKFVLVDPKKVELNLFSKIERHFLAKLPDAEEAIVTETRQVIRTLHSLCTEMDNRYDLLKDAQARNIKEYNAKFIARRLNPNHGHRFLPYIVLFIDEFADLIMTAGKEVELPIARLAQLARAVGLHLIIATQRPSVNIITGTIKANFPARIAFRVTSKIDSRTILDTGGAEQLIGRGDMLLSTGSDLLRLQCAFIDTPEIERITEFIGSQRAYADAYHLPEYYEEDGGGSEPIEPGERDELFEDAARVIVATQQGSTSLLQRKLKLGYNRAGRIIDQLEAAGIVGPFEGSKAREVKIKDEATLERILRGEE